MLPRAVVHHPGVHSTSIVASDELIEHVPEAGSFGLSSDTPRAGSSTGPWLAVGVVAVYVILTILVFLPVSPWDPHSLPVCNCADYAKMTSYLAWTPFALLHGQNIFFTNYQDYPYGVNLAGNTNIPLLGILMAPVTLTAGPIAAMNLVAHIGVASSAASAYFVLRRYVSYWPAAFTGGLLYGFSPYVMAHAHGHPNLIFVPLLPVLVLLADEVLIRQKMTARRAGIITGLVCAAQYGISSELLAEAAVVGVVAVVLLAIARPREAMRRFPYVARSLVWAGIVSAPFVGYPIWMALDGPGHIVGAAQPVLALEAFRGDLLSAVVPTVTERFSLGHLGAVSSSWVSGNLMENTAYLGVPLIVALVAIVVRYRKDKGLVLLGALLVASYVATLGYSLDVGGKATGVPMPLWIGFHLPLLDSVVSTRYFVFGYMFAAMILALGMQRLHEAGTGRGRTVAVVVLAVVVLLPIVPRFPMGRLPSTPSAVNASYPVPTFFSSQSDLAPVPSGSVALVYPISLGEWPNYSVLWQSVAGFRFKLPDADSYMPGNDGSATARPPTLRPVLLQDLMQEAYFGSPRGRDPFVDPSSPATVAGIRRAMTRYTFDTVVVAPDGSDPSEFMKAVTLALGAPPDRVDGVFVWYDVPADLARLGTPATG